MKSSIDSLSESFIIRPTSAVQSNAPRLNQPVVEVKLPG